MDSWIDMPRERDTGSKQSMDREMEQTEKWKENVGKRKQFFSGNLFQN